MLNTPYSDGYLIQRMIAILSGIIYVHDMQFMPLAYKGVLITVQASDG